MKVQSSVTTKWAGDEYKTAFRIEMLDGYMRSAEMIRDNAKSRIHNVSGALAGTVRASISVEQNAAFVFAGSRKNRIYYAHFVEFGTYNKRAHPFMRPALDSCFNATLAEAEREGKNILLRKRIHRMRASKKKVSKRIA